MRIFAYLKALAPILLGIGMLVGGIFLFAYLVATVPATSLPLLGIFTFFGSIPVFVFHAGRSWAELQFTRMKYMNGPKVAKRAELKDLKNLRRNLLQSFARYSGSREEYYKQLCQIEIKIAQAKGKPYKYPKYQPGKDSDW